MPTTKLEKHLASEIRKTLVKKNLAQLSRGVFGQQNRLHLLIKNTQSRLSPAQALKLARILREWGEELIRLSDKLEIHAPRIEPYHERINFVKTVGPGTLREQVIEIVRKNPGIRACDLARAVGREQDKVTPTFRRLEDQQILQKVKAGRTVRYYLARTPAAAAEDPNDWVNWLGFRAAPQVDSRDVLTKLEAWNL